MNANFIFNPALALRLPYSTLAAGVILMPIPPGPKGGITLVSTVMIRKTRLPPQASMISMRAPRGLLKWTFNTGLVLSLVA